METKSSIESSSSSSDHDPNKWLQVQDELKKKLITEDDFTWKIGDSLKYIGGVDISFLKDNSSVACGTLVVLDFETLDVVYEDYVLVQIEVPYVAGFLGFRELQVASAQLCFYLTSKYLSITDNTDRSTRPAPTPKDDMLSAVLKLTQQPALDSIRPLCGTCSSIPATFRENAEWFSSFLPSGFGSACHLGVLANLPTIGIGKNLHHVDGLTNSKVRELMEAEENSNLDFISLIGDSGNTLGAAINSSRGSFKPIFVSVGHRVSLASAVEVVRRTCKYRVPEPIRQLIVVPRAGYTISLDGAAALRKRAKYLTTVDIY
ncbi:endonuclease V [Tanacetum coccineum]